MIKEILKKTLMLSAIITFLVFSISNLFFNAPKETMIIYQILLLSFSIILIQQLLKRNLFDIFLLNIVVEYIIVSVFVLLYGYFFQWFYKSNWWLVFLYVAIVYIPAYFLDVTIVKRDIEYINKQLVRRRENDGKTHN
ncbi:MAG: hypothetical protein QM644_13030 [Mobilitalea sp.]